MRSAASPSSPHPWFRCLGWLLALALMFRPMEAEAAAANPHLQTALKRYDDLEYEEALSALGKARQWPGSTLEEQVYIELLEGVLAFELNQPERGKSAFQRALALNPEARLPLRVSPKVVRQLEEARDERQALQKKAPVAEGATPTATEEAVRSEPPVGARLRLPIAIGGGVVAVGGLLALVQARSLASDVRSADDSIRTREDLDDTLSRGRTYETVGWGLMGLGVAATVGSLLFLKAPAPAPQAAVSPTRGGAHFSLSWVLP